MKMLGRGPFNLSISDFGPVNIKAGFESTKLRLSAVSKGGMLAEISILTQVIHRSCKK